MMIDYIVDTYGFDNKRLLVIGDTYESDIEMAKRAGTLSILLADKDSYDIPTFSSVLEVFSYFLERSKRNE